MTSEEIAKLTDEQLVKAIKDIGNHPLAERFTSELNKRK